MEEEELVINVSGKQAGSSSELLAYKSTQVSVPVF